MQKFKIEYKKLLIPFFLITILVFALWFRVYRIDQVLGFYFDQGRDANVVFDLIEYKKIFLIGPTTGIAGIFRGPFYYYLITPAYFLGNGNPVFVSVFLSILTVLGLFFVYILGKREFGNAAGIIALAVGAFSFNIVLSSRWLSNPTPMFLLSVLLVYCLYKIAKGYNFYWIFLGFIAGSSLFHFGSSGEFFYFPAIFIFLIFNWKNRPSIKVLLLSFVSFFVTFLPLLVFDLRHDGILRNNILKFFVGDQSFKIDFWKIIQLRTNFYIDVFVNKIFESRGQLENILLIVVLLFFLINIPKFLKNKLSRILIIFLTTLYVGILFFQGNEGNFYDYYVTGYYLIFILMFGIVLSQIWKYRLGKIFVLVFFFAFFRNNIALSINRYSDKLDGESTIALGNQKKAMDWIYSDANFRQFSVDVYVPPVIPHSYDYLFRWYGGRVKGYEPSTEIISPLYTLYEVDPPHPERLNTWLNRQEGIGKVEKEARFGGIIVQRRIRL